MKDHRTTAQAGVRARAVAEGNRSITVNDLRNATSKEGESQAVTPRVASGTGAGVTRPRTAVIGKATDAVIRRTTGTETAAVAMIVVMIVVGAGECQPKVSDQTASGVRDSTIPCILALVRSSNVTLITHGNELINIAEPAGHPGPPDNSVTGVCGIPPQKA